QEHALGAELQLASEFAHEENDDQKGGKNVEHFRPEPAKGLRPARVEISTQQVRVVLGQRVARVDDPCEQIIAGNGYKELIDGMAFRVLGPRLLSARFVVSKIGPQGHLDQFQSGGAEGGFIEGKRIKERS